MTQYIRTSSVRAAVSIFYATVVVALLATGVWAQTGRITGRVVDQDTGDPLVDAKVEIMSPGVSTKWGSISDVNGRYSVQRNPAHDLHRSTRAVEQRDLVLVYR